MRRTDLPAAVLLATVALTACNDKSSARSTAAGQQSGTVSTSLSASAVSTLSAAGSGADSAPSSSEADGTSGTTGDNGGGTSATLNGVTGALADTPICIRMGEQMEIEARGTWEAFGDGDLAAEIKGTEVLTVSIVTDKGGPNGAALHATYDAATDGPSAPAVISGNTYTVTGKVRESSTGPAVAYSITFNCGS